MLIKLSNFTFNTDDVKLIVPRQDGTFTAFLSLLDGGRTLNLDAPAYAKLDLILSAAGRVDLDDNLQTVALEKTAALRREIFDRNAYLAVKELDEFLRGLDRRLTEIINGQARQPDPQAIERTKTGPTPVPPRPPLPSDDEDPDPLLFLPKRGPRPPGPFDDL